MIWAEERRGGKRNGDDGDGGILRVWMLDTQSTDVSLRNSYALGTGPVDPPQENHKMGGQNMDVQGGFWFDTPVKPVSLRNSDAGGTDFTYP